MSDYRRLISYIYEYEGKKKGKNVGFVKLEARNGQCRLSLSVKNVYVGGNAIGVYLLSRNGTEAFLGNIFIRSGNGEFRAAVDARNVEGTGGGLDTYYGLTIHDVKNPWRSYTTIWEDAVTPETLPGSLPGNSGGDTVKMLPAQEILPGSQNKETDEPMGGVASVVRQIEEEIAREEERKSREAAMLQAAEVDSAESGEQPGSGETGPGAVSGAAGGEEELSGIGGAGEEPQLSGTAGAAAEIFQSPEPGDVPGMNRAQEESEKKGAETVSPEPESGKDQDSGQLFRDSGQPSQDFGNQPGSPSPAEEPPAVRSPELENPEVLKYLQETEDMAADPEKLWQELRKTYPKIQPFDYENGCEILTIRPQDIGRLPRESWVYGNNSFLLHGYYNFRYIILFRLGSRNGSARYLIGVPGHYYSSEKYMASMFGFPNFVLSKKQPPNDGRFGYWYTDIRVR